MDGTNGVLFFQIPVCFVAVLWGWAIFKPAVR